MKRPSLSLLLLVAAALVVWNQLDVADVVRPEHAATAEVVQAFNDRASDVQVTGDGVVKKLLPDDVDGSRHQRFILSLPSGHTLLVAHNIDLAAKIASLRVGDVVAFSGEYEYNPQGGVLHWTHHDPQGRHAAGWLQHDGRTYQ